MDIKIRIASELVRLARELTAAGDEAADKVKFDWFWEGEYGKITTKDGKDNGKVQELFKKIEKTLKNKACHDVKITDDTIQFKCAPPGKSAQADVVLKLLQKGNSSLKWPNDGNSQEIKGFALDINKCLD